MEVCPILQEKMKHLDILEKDISRKIKSEIANLVLGYEDPEYVNDSLAYVLATYGKIITNEKEILENITIQDISEVIGKVSMKEMNTFVVNPIKKDEN